MPRRSRVRHAVPLLLAAAALVGGVAAADGAAPLRDRVLLDTGWRFHRGEPTPGPDAAALRPYVRPTANRFLSDPTRRATRPTTSPTGDVPYACPDFDDAGWDRVTVPHDWAIAGPFTAAGGGGMGRLPTAGVGWYRRTLDGPPAGRSVFLDVDGAMSFATVWLNGTVVGGWPYGYASWRVDLTPYVVPGRPNELAIRLDNPPDSSRWYPGGGLYRHVWVTETNPVHVGQWGTRVTTPQVSAAAATVDVAVTVDNDSGADATVSVTTDVYAIDAAGVRTGDVVSSIGPVVRSAVAGGSVTVDGTATISRPRLWGPPPGQTPNRYMAVTTVSDHGRPVDRYETRFGVRELRWDPAVGLLVNGGRTYIKGVNQHHDLGALGAAFNVRAARRQLEVLREMGCNAIRTSHNPPAPELLELTDAMGFLVMDEIFDCWDRKKTPNDFHTIFPDWHEPDLRAFVRRDRNCPSVVLWSVGNEVGEQMTGEAGAAVARELCGIVHAEDPARPATASMNWAKPDMPFPAAFDVVSLNYQGAGVRNTPGQYPAFRARFPSKVILSSETASALSTRGEYLFPVSPAVSGPVRDGAGGDAKRQVVSGYELYAADFGSSADRVFASQDRNPFVAGEFVWTGWDYLGEPTPYDAARSSYSGIVDLSGFKKDRFYLYQATWRPDLPMAHILPHWTWPERVGQVTPVHVFTSGDAAELFLNGRSMGRRTKGKFEYRLRWDDVVYEPGELKVVATKDGHPWATDGVATAGPAARLEATADRADIVADGRDLSFVTIRVVDAANRPVPRAFDHVRFSLTGPGRIVATDNGDPRGVRPFPAADRDAFNGLCLAIVRADPGAGGTITLHVAADGLAGADVALRATGR